MLPGQLSSLRKNIAVGVQNLDAAVKWYSTRLAVYRNFLRSDASEAFLAFSMDDDEPGLMLALIRPRESYSVHEADRSCSKLLLAARYFQWGQSKVAPAVIGFFEFQDLEGNKIEVCTGPK